MSNMTTLRAYRNYLALTYLLKRAEAADVEYMAGVSLNAPRGGGGRLEWDERYDKIVAGEIEVESIHEGLYQTEIELSYVHAFSSPHDEEMFARRVEAATRFHAQTTGSLLFVELRKAELAVFGRTHDISWRVYFGCISSRNVFDELV